MIYTVRLETLHAKTTVIQVYTHPPMLLRMMKKTNFTEQQQQVVDDIPINDLKLYWGETSMLK